MPSAKTSVKWGASPRKQEARSEASAALDAFVGSKGSTKRLNLDIPVALHTRIKVACALAGRDMKTVVTELLEQQFPEQ